MARTLAVLALLVSSSAGAAPINYGDFVSGTVMYLDVTETANSPGDSEPLFGAPSLVGTRLDFDPAGFAATATGGAGNVTDGQLNLTLMGVAGTAITSLTFRERGDYSLLGTGTSTTLVNYAVGASAMTVLEIDGVALSSPVTLSPASASGGDNLGAGSDALTPWSLGLTYDFGSALASAGVPFQFGATKIEIAMDNMLAAISQTSSIAAIAKKDFFIDVTTTRFTVPEPPGVSLVAPPGLVLFATSLWGFGWIGRRRAFSPRK